MKMKRPIKKRVVTSSELNTFKACRQKHELSYILGYKPRLVGPATIFGQAAHNAKEVRYLGGTLDACNRAIDATFERFLVKNKKLIPKWKKPKYEDAQVRCVKVNEAYWQEYAIDDWTPAILDGKPAVEVEFLVPIYTPFGRASRFFLFSGKIDLIIRDADKRYWIVDHKTRADIGKSAYQKLIIDQQMRAYCWAARIYWGIDIAGVIYNLIRTKPESQVKVNKDGRISKSAVDASFDTIATFIRDHDEHLGNLSEEYRKENKIKFDCASVYDHEDLLAAAIDNVYFRRHSQTYTEDDLMQVQGELYQVCMWMHRCQFIDRVDSACDHFGGCQYKPICLGLETEGLFKTGSTHTELSETNFHPPVGRGYNIGHQEPTVLGMDGMLDSINA